MHRTKKRKVHGGGLHVAPPLHKSLGNPPSQQILFWLQPSPSSLSNKKPGGGGDKLGIWAMEEDDEENPPIAVQIHQQIEESTSSLPLHIPQDAVGVTVITGYLGSGKSTVTAKNPLFSFSLSVVLGPYVRNFCRIIFPRLFLTHWFYKPKISLSLSLSLFAKQSIDCFNWLRLRFYWNYPQWVSGGRKP